MKPDQHSKHPLYRKWTDMRNRCKNPKNPSYKYYGAKGIYVELRWNSFANFLEDMGEMPFPKCFLGRKDHSKPYGPDNCRWEIMMTRSRLAQLR